MKEHSSVSFECHHRPSNRAVEWRDYPNIRGVTGGYHVQMNSNGDQERRRLFRLYSINLSNNFPELVGLFACPICGKLFREDDVLHGPALKVDLGHAFPKEIGGKHVVLECCECNGRLNRAGDNELVKLQKQWDAMLPERRGAPIRGAIHTSSGRVGAKISANGIHAHWKKAHPQAFNDLLQALQTGGPIHLSRPEISQQKINVAFLHAAHLLFFREFGYGYLASPAGQYVRELLVHAESLPDDAFLSVELPKTMPVDPPILFRLAVCTMPDGDKYLSAALPVADPSASCQFILLPGLWDAGGVEFKRLLLRRGETWIHGMNYRTIDRGNWRQLVAPEYHNALALAWSGWEPHNVDMTKLMWAIRTAAQDKTDRKVDARPIGLRMGFGEAVPHYVRSLADRGFLVRVPKQHRPLLVRLTEKSIAA